MSKKVRIAQSRALSIVRKYFPNVDKIKDARTGLVVKVTKQDEQTSKRKKHEECAMAVACKRSMHLSGVIISVKTAYLIKNNTATRFSVPESVSREVVSFDRGGGFEPGRYTLLKPSHPLGQGQPRGGASSGHKKSKAYAITKNIRTVLGSDTEK